MRRSLIGAAVVLLVAATACGNDNSALAQTEANMAKIQTGTIDLRLAANAGTGASETGPVGFALEGPFSFSSDHDLAVFDMTYTRLLGENKRVTRVRSTGKEAFVTLNGTTTEVDDDQLGPLRVSEDASGGLGDLGISGWVRNSKETPGDKVDGELTDVITGDVDVGDMLSDLARIARSVGGDTQLAALDGDAGARLQKLVRGSSIRVVTTAKKRELRALSAAVDFGTRAPAELRKILGAYADARIEVNLSLRKASKPLHVEAPS
jgi:hypothetical protein